MNDFRDLLAPGAVLTRLTASTRKQVIQRLAESLSRVAGLDPRAVCEAVMRRERLAGTGIGEGVALPHALTEGLRRPLCGFARLETPADFQAPDGRGADLVVMLLSPPASNAEHLKALAKLSRLLRRAEVRDGLRAARGFDELMAAFDFGRAVHAA
ncbi:MAG TPA: PTS sugar transporter subunit IIA [Caulobacterales bacterium]|nr:PTS sugar transporter subunit IIA [Caulobacterales bacterium]